MVVPWLIFRVDGEVAGTFADRVLNDAPRDRLPTIEERAGHGRGKKHGPIGHRNSLGL